MCISLQYGQLCTSAASRWAIAKKTQNLDVSLNQCNHTTGPFSYTCCHYVPGSGGAVLPYCIVSIGPAENKKFFNSTSRLGIGLAYEKSYFKTIFLATRHGPGTYPDFGGSESSTCASIHDWRQIKSFGWHGCNGRKLALDLAGGFSELHC